ncbi:sulfurtransferase [Kitasatospora sp. MMS16-BH015]|uniref:sulfurtransferase n=1 Tax=Kitasatospora sp. MMS16-BH015 TaxID=2018025 RepID=UPI000CF29C32|nr:sulfurtransferase [Kitasatospora sp. MMS16-BH015]
MDDTSTSPLITVAELRRALGSDHPPTLLDVRYKQGGAPGAAEFAAGHLPSAHFVDLDRDLAAPPGSAGRHPLPDLDAFGAAMRRVGVSAGRTVVLYDDWVSAAASRAWWLLRWAGHTDVRVLDGGLSAWRAAGLPLTDHQPGPENGDFKPVAGHLPTLDAAGTAAFTGLLLDARAGERYRGEVEPFDPAAGHIPGAVNAPTMENVGPDGRFLPAEQLAERFRSLGVGEGETAVYCGSGVTAAHQLLAMAVAGFEGTLYPGSWSEWCADPSRPVATGA